jgi:nucleoside-diphosphate-sugar epimerase
VKISVVGFGWYGTPLGEALAREGHPVVGTTRTEEKRRLLEARGLVALPLAYPALPAPALLDCDVLVLNVPPFEGQLDWFRRWEWDPKTWVIFVSSTSVTPAPDSRSGQLLKAQEEWVTGNFSSWTILRFGGLLGADRHPGKHLSGRKNLPGRRWPVNLIHREDTVGATLAVIATRSTGEVFHVVADEHPTREEFYTGYCRRENLPLPEFDAADASPGKLVSNEDLRRIYRPRRSLTE